MFHVPIHVEHNHVSLNDYILYIHIDITSLRTKQSNRIVHTHVLPMVERLLCKLHTEVNRLYSVDVSTLSLLKLSVTITLDL